MTLIKLFHVNETISTGFTDVQNRGKTLKQRSAYDSMQINNIVNKVFSNRIEISFLCDIKSWIKLNDQSRVRNKATRVLISESFRFPSLTCKRMLWVKERKIPRRWRKILSRFRWKGKMKKKIFAARVSSLGVLFRHRIFFAVVFILCFCFI